MTSILYKIRQSFGRSNRPLNFYCCHRLADGTWRAGSATKTEPAQRDDRVSAHKNND